MPSGSQLFDQNVRAVCSYWLSCQYGLVIDNLYLAFCYNLKGVVLVPILTSVYMKVFQDFKMIVLAYIIVACKIFALCQGVACT